MLYVGGLLLLLSDVALSYMARCKASGGRCMALATAVNAWITAAVYVPYTSHRGPGEQNKTPISADTCCNLKLAVTGAKRTWRA